MIIIIMNIIIIGITTIKYTEYHILLLLGYFYYYYKV